MSGGKGCPMGLSSFLRKQPKTGYKLCLFIITRSVCLVGTNEPEARR